VAEDFGYFFSFINPTHSIDFYKQVKDPPALARAIDLLGRIFTGYGIYQFVAAFRRHGRKGV
jgi:hypothetical protein